MPTERPALQLAAHFPSRPRLVLVAALLAAAQVQAQEDGSSPWYLGGSAALTHVSNIYRLPTASQPVDLPNSDDVATLSLLAGVDKPLGRQRLFGDLAVRHNRYRRDSRLDNTGYGLAGGLDWAMLDKWSGSLTLRSNRNLAQYNPSTEVAQITEKNIEQSDQAQFLARYGLAGALSLEGGAGYQRRDYSAEAYRLLNFRQHSVFAGVGWRASGALRLNLTGRETRGSGYARLLVFTVPYDYRRKDLEASANWRPSEASTLDARVSFSRINNDNSNLDNYSGLTGRLGWQWKPTAKLQLNASLARDTVQENYLFTGLSGSSEANRVTDTLQLGGTYALTSKLMLDATARAARLGRSGLATGDDREQSYALGLRWLPTRHSQLGCQATRDKRTSDIATLNYSASSYGCYGQLTLR